MEEADSMGYHPGGKVEHGKGQTTLGNVPRETVSFRDQAGLQGLIQADDPVGYGQEEGGCGVLVLDKLLVRLENI